MKHSAARLAILAALVVLGSIRAPLASAQSSPANTQALIKQLQDLVRSLQVQIVELKVQLEAASGEIQEIKAEVKEFQITQTLGRGTRSDEVRLLQEFLKQDPEIYPDGLVTGFFGIATEAAVKKFQEKHGIEAVGIVGPKTRAKLQELITQGAGASGKIPPGLLIAPGISREPPTTAIPVSPAPAATATPPATPAPTATTTAPVVPPPPVAPATTTPAAAITPGAEPPLPPADGGSTSAPAPLPGPTPTPPPSSTTNTTATTVITALPDLTIATATTTTATTAPSTTTTTSPAAATALSDLTILGFQSPRSATVGQSITLQVQVRNAGQNAAPSSKLLVAFSQTSNYDSTAQFYKDVIAETKTILDVPSIIPSSPDAERLQSNTAWVSWQTTIPQTTLSSLYFVAKSDPDNLVAEETENNNSSGTQISISQPVNLRVSTSTAAAAQRQNLASILTSLSRTLQHLTQILSP